ncbi:MAG TPA: peptide deformylase [Ktedonobacterales bacterium]|nr:peptide deformylase [Ktedonobacterales bacterium]
MAKRRILVVDNPNERRILRAKAKKVSRFDAYLERLVSDMWETMREAPGVGLAAPQVGESIRVLVAEYEGEAVALVNPEILKRSEEEELGQEGCLSIPGYLGDDVPRANAVTVKARDPRGKEVRVKAEGWFARILQHEIDHLDGILYTDRIAPDKVREVTEADIEPEGAPPPEKPARKGKQDGKQARSTASAASGATSGAAGGEA